MFGCKTDCARTIIEQKIGAKNLEVKYYMMMMEGVEFHAYFYFENQLWVILFFCKEILLSKEVAQAKSWRHIGFKKNIALASSSLQKVKKNLEAQNCSKEKKNQEAYRSTPPLPITQNV